MTEESAPVSTGPPDALIGRLVAGKYRIQGLIARGGMGRIYQAEQIPIGRPVALKVLNARYEEVEPNFEKRFLQEAATCGKLRHPNTVVLYDYGRMEDGNLSTLFMAMELIEGPTLRRVIKEHGTLAEGRAVAIARGIGRSLREAHKLGIVHRDLKPSNVMLVQNEDGEQVKVVDFGVAKLMHSDGEALTMADNIVGSPRYMAPEQIRNQAVDGRTDIYAVGVLLFEMLSGRAPFEGDRALDTLMLHISAEFPTIKARSGRDVDPALEAIVRKATARDAKDRYSDVDDLLKSLSRWARQHGESDHTDEHVNGPAPDRRVVVGDVTDNSGTLPNAVPPNPRPARNRWLPPVAIVAAIGGFLLLVSIPLLGRDTPEVPPPSVAAPEPLATVVPEPAPPAAVTLRLLTEPPGAEVWEGTQLLGPTPLPVPLSVNSPERSFTLKLAGYADATVVQAGAPADLERAVVLQKVAKKAVPRPATKKPDDLKRNR